MRALLGTAAGFVVFAAAGGSGAIPNPARELAYAGARLPFEAGGPREDQVGDLFVMRADGTARRRLTRTLDAEDAPSWSPRGERIASSRGLPACHANRCSGTLEADIWTLSADGSAARRLTRGRASRLIDTSPTWSPDGGSIAFVRRNCCDAAPADGVYVVGSEGGAVRRLSPVRALAVDWGPGGRSIAVAPENGGPLLVDAASGERRSLGTAGLPATATVRDVAWSPEGGRLALATSRGLYVVQHGRATRVGPSRAVSGVDWARDGKTLAYATSDLFLVQADGSRPRRVTDGAGAELAPAWR